MKFANYIKIVLVMLFLYSCNDSFMDRTPTDNLNDVTFWKTQNDLETYNNGIYNTAASNDYEFLTAYSNSGYNAFLYSVFSREMQSDNMVTAKSEQFRYANIAAGLESMPTSANFENKWKWEFLRRCNVFLEKYTNAEIQESIKQNYAGEAYFWRAWFYLDKVQWLGDVPFINKPLNVDSEELYAPRDSRILVMDSVLADINRAIDWLPADWGANKPDRVTRWTALALKSRICLYEGTYRKYHTMQDSEKFLREAVNASRELISSAQYAIYSSGNPEKDLWTLFNSENLSNNPEVILPLTYETPALGHSKGRALYEASMGWTKDLVDDFLCIETDGTAKPVALSNNYNEDVFENIFKNRDPRLSQTALDPEQESEYIGTNDGYPGIANIGPVWKSLTGYHCIKFFDKREYQKAGGMEIDDYPVIRYAEVLLNYAEAKAELGEITQQDLDDSINQLRKRVNMPDLTLNPPMDPKYANLGLSSLLVEIRRERRVELAGENFRYQDLMRWKQGKQLAQRYLGTRVEDKDIAEGGRFQGLDVARFEVDGKKYIDAYAGTNYAAEKRVFDENKHYLHPIPINVLTKNPNLKQNPGWGE